MRRPESISLRQPSAWLPDGGGIPFPRIPRAGLHSVLKGLWSHTSESVSEHLWSACCVPLAVCSNFRGCGPGWVRVARATVPGWPESPCVWVEEEICSVPRLGSSTSHREAEPAWLRSGCHRPLSAPWHCPGTKGPSSASLGAEAESWPFSLTSCASPWSVFIRETQTHFNTNLNTRFWENQ